MIIDVPAGFSSTDLLALLQSEGAEGEGLSTQEIAEATGRSTGWVRNRLLELSKAGKLRVTRKRSQRVDGTPCLVPAYSLVEGEGAEKGETC